MTRDEGQGPGEKEEVSGDAGPPTDKKPWPMSWILIVILGYIVLQTAYFLIYGD